MPINDDQEEIDQNRVVFNSKGNKNEELAGEEVFVNDCLNLQTEYQHSNSCEINNKIINSLHVSDDFPLSTCSQMNDDSSQKLTKNEKFVDDKEHEKILFDSQDSFDDFQTHLCSSFQKSTELEMADHSNQIICDQNLNEDEDFADFTSFNVSNSVENFTNFSNMNEQLQNQIGSKIDQQNSIESDDFADFESANVFNTNKEDSIQHKSTNLSKKNIEFSQECIKSFITNAFPTDASSSNLNELESNYNEKIIKNFFEFKFSKHSEPFWISLQKINFKSSFSFDKWKKSETFNRMLNALKIDPRNVILADLFPSYVSTTYNQVLQPTSYDYSSNKNSSNFSDEKHEKLFESKRKDSNNSNELYIRKQNISINTQTEQFQTPVFDLSQDLDFFESKYNIKRDNSSNSIKEDLIDQFEDLLTMENLEDSGVIQKSNETQGKNHLPQPFSSIKNFQEILMVNNNSNLKNSSVKQLAKNNNEQVLSAAALNILSELPNLSYMRAKVLMFPINESHNDEIMISDKNNN